MTIREWNPVAYLTNKTSIANYLKPLPEEVEEGIIDYQLQALCLTDAIQAHAINQLAVATGINRELVYETISGITHDPTIVKKLQTAFIATLEPARELANV